MHSTVSLFQAMGGAKKLLLLPSEEGQLAKKKSSYLPAQTFHIVEGASIAFEMPFPPEANVIEIRAV